MVNKYELNKAWQKLTMARLTNECISNNKRLSDTTFAVLALIAHHDNITIHGVEIHPYFNNISLSTIKRCVNDLISANLVNAEISSRDKRERLLTVMEEY